MSRRLLLVSSFVLCVTPSSWSQEPPRWWNASVEQALERAGDQRAPWEEALRTTPEEQRAGMAFLLEHMTDRDLTELEPAALRTNVALAYEARRLFPWATHVPEELFLNDVLPHAHVSERRDPWRADLFERCRAWVKDCTTASEAVQTLNRTLWKELGVRYSTARRAADQGTRETIESGLASCTGLSILLASACRTVGIPARLAGIPRWVNKDGNHTWVEVWDGTWHFTGAAEPDGRGLDHTWFQADAALARADVPEHSIWAVSYRRTDTPFPMVWSRRGPPVFAVNVTARYAPAPEAASTRVRVHLSAREGERRVAADVEVFAATAEEGGEPLARGRTRDEGFDRNDFLTVEVEPGRSYRIVFRKGDRVHVVAFEAPAAGEAHVAWDGEPPTADGVDDEALSAALTGWFRASDEERASWVFEKAHERALAREEARVRALAWQAYRAVHAAGAMREDFDADRVQWNGHVAPYVVRPVGERPAGGWPLVIAMHGGGGVPKRVNDQQWGVMQRYYRDQEGLSYLYLALRAPNDTWNGFYDVYSGPLVAQLIRQFALHGDVDPARVSLIGYSHGGYGAFVVGTKVPDRFAAVHASAAAPTPGQTAGRNLRTTPFTYMIGEKDLAYGRLPRCRAFDEQIAGWRGDRDDVYPVRLEEKAGYGHGGLPDRDKVRDLHPHVRDPVPAELSWDLTDGVVSDFFWIHVPQPAAGARVDAVRAGQRVTVTFEGVERIDLLLDARMVDLSRPVVVRANDGEPRAVRVRPSLLTLCETLEHRGDPALAFAARLSISR